MTLKQRNILLAGGLAVSAFLFILFLYQLIAIMGELPRPGIVSFFTDRGPSGARRTFPIFGESLYSVSAGFILFFFFRKTKSVEIFFFLLFVFSISFEGMKIVIARISLNSGSPVLGMTITRLIYGARIFGTGCVLASGLHVHMGKYQKLDFILYTILLLAFTFASLIPIDASGITPGGLLRSSSHFIVTVPFLISECGAVLSFLIYGRESKAKEYQIMGAALALVIAGRFLLTLNLGTVPSLFGLASLSTGTLLFALETHSVYLWL